MPDETPLFTETQRATGALLAALYALDGSPLAEAEPELAAHLEERLTAALRHTNRVVQMIADAMDPHPFTFDPEAGW